MSITAIRTQIQSELATSVSGVTTAYYPAPQLAPTEMMLPCFVIEKDKPFLTATDEAQSLMRYTWHFKIKFLFSMEGISSYDQWMLNLEPYYAQTVAALEFNKTVGAQGSQSQSIDTSLIFDEGEVDYLGTKYYGFELKCDVWEKINTVMQ